MMPTADATPTDYADTPQGWAQRWAVELKAAQDAVKSWHEQGKRIIKRYKDVRETTKAEESRWNLFTANVQTQQSLLYGKTPAVSVDRRFADANDDVARVAGEILSRLLNSDVERDSDSYADALAYALQDRLLPGFGAVRIRYVVETEVTPETPAVVAPDGRVLAEAVPGVERKTYECVETDYLHWRDMLWSPARVWHEVRWVAFRGELGKEQVTQRFGAQVADAIPYALTTSAKEDRSEGAVDPWARAVVWEIWDKSTRRVFWYLEGHGVTLDSKPDPLGLESFFPCPRPLLANATTDEYLPRPDFVLAQDLYDAVDTLTTRIDSLTAAVAVRGVFDKSSGSLQQLLTSGGGNKLIPVDNWAMFAEKGGLRGVVDWLPLEEVVNAITVLDQRRETAKAALYEVTGMSDLLRGQAVAANATATEQSIKARFASVRLQALQDEFARFASDVQRLKAEVVAKHYDAETILSVANAQAMFDAQLAQQAVALIKSDVSKYRVVVKPESVSMTDFAQLQSERTGMLQAVTAFMTGAAPLAQQMPGSLPFLLRMLQWFVSGQRGASEIEGVLDQAVAAAEAQAQQPQQAPPPDPKLLLAQVKAQGDLAKVQAETQARLVELNAEVQADEQRERNQRVENVLEAAAKQQLSQAGRVVQDGRQPRGSR